MAPRRRAAKVGLQRIDAALDAVRPMGFKGTLVRKTIKTLLKVYGGDEGWPFIEGDAYKLLIEALLEEVEKSETRDEEPKSLTFDESNLLTDNASPTENDSTQDGHGKEVHLADNPSVVVDSFAVADIVPCSSRKDAISDNQKLQVDSTHSATTEIVSLFRKSEIADATTPESHSSPFVPLATVCTPQVGSCSHRKRRPCYGWLSSDDEGEPDLVYFTPDAR